mmetsp:Transcript_965/g.2707  ORF Transcript_965/g.2707 Transcript_965/m.2707 type:complete len:266 (-) Transcript_965:3444-4241(-)
MLMMLMLMPMPMLMMMLLPLPVLLPAPHRPFQPPPHRPRRMPMPRERPDRKLIPRRAKSQEECPPSQRLRPARQRLPLVVPPPPPAPPPLPLALALALVLALPVASPRRRPTPSSPSLPLPPPATMGSPTPTPLSNSPASALPVDGGRDTSRTRPGGRIGRRPASRRCSTSSSTPPLPRMPRRSLRMWRLRVRLRANPRRRRGAMPPTPPMPPVLKLRPTKSRRSVPMIRKQRRQDHLPSPRRELCPPGTFTFVAAVPINTASGS